MTVKWTNVHLLYHVLSNRPLVSYLKLCQYIIDALCYFEPVFLPRTEFVLYICLSEISLMYVCRVVILVTLFDFVYLVLVHRLCFS